MGKTKKHIVESNKMVDEPIECKCQCKEPELINKPSLRYDGSWMDYCRKCKHNRIIDVFVLRK